jgi:hypothetical protein
VPPIDAHQQLWLLACRRVRQYQTTANIIAGAALGITVLLLWPAAVVGVAGVVWTLTLVALINGAAAGMTTACRRWARFYHAESEHWLDRLVPAEERDVFTQGFAATSPLPTALSTVWTRVLAGTAIASAAAAFCVGLINRG